MRAKIALLLSASLLTGAIAATAQPLPCASVAPEVRERVREDGACRDPTPDDVALKGAAPAPSSAVTMKLSDGTVVRIPREISSNINDGRKRAATNKTAAQKRVPRAGESAQSKPDASGGPVPALQKLEVPDVIGRSYVDAGSALAEFKVDRIETANSAPAGEVLAQEPAPGSLVPPGSGVSLQVSDGSLASAADATSVTAPATAAAPPSAPAPAADPGPATAPDPAPATAADPAPATAADSTPASQPTVPPATRGRFPIAFSANTALILGAGVLLGLLLGALLMRQWLLRREPAADENAAPPTLYQSQEPVEIGVGGVSSTEAAPEIRFAARLEPGETTIELAPLADGEEVAIEHSSDQHG
jgi:PASTA domain